MNKITDFNKQKFIESVIESNKELYSYIHLNISSSDFLYSNTIGYGGDNSLNIDIYAENLFIKHLSSFGNIYSEECGFINNQSDFTIIIDPIDGSDNFFSGLAYFGSSVALKYKDEVIAGFVCNLAVGTFIYRAFNSEIIEISFNDSLYINKSLESSKIGIFERAYRFPTLCKKLYDNNIKFRSPGAVAISLAYSSNYNFVLFAGNIRDFDVMAALYICKKLFIEKNDKFLLISKNKDKFNQIKEIIKKNKL